MTYEAHEFMDINIISSTAMPLDSGATGRCATFVALDSCLLSRDTRGLGKCYMMTPWICSDAVLDSPNGSGIAPKRFLEPETLWHRFSCGHVAR